MKAIARYVPMTAVRHPRVGVSAVIVLTIGACAAAHASQAYAPVLIVVAVAVASAVGALAGHRMRVEAVAESEERAFALTRGLVVALLRADAAAALQSLEQGADPDGHRRAGGLGAPLVLARLHGMKSTEASLCLRGAAPTKGLDPADHRALVQLAKDERLEPVVVALEQMLTASMSNPRERRARRAVETRRLGSAL